MKKSLLLILFSLFHAMLFSQTDKVDSLTKLLKTDKEDTNKLFRLNNIARGYIEIGVFDSSLRYAGLVIEKSDALLKTTKNKTTLSSIKRQKANGYINLGYSQECKRNFDDAFKSYTASLKIMQELGHKTGIANTYCFLGILFDEQGNYPEALKNYFASLKLYEALNNKSDIAAAYNNIGYVYYKQGNYEDALKNNFSSLEVEKARNNQEGISNSYLNIGIVYDAQGKTDDALAIYMKALEIMKKLNDKYGEGRIYNNIGVVYSDQAKQLKDKKLQAELLDKSLKNHMASLKIREDMDDKIGISSSYINIGSVYTKQGKYKEARIYLEKAEQLSKEIDYKENLKFTHYHAEKLDSLTGNYKGAYINHKLFIQYRDSLDNEETRRKTVQNQMSFEFEKKEAVAVAEHKLELESQQSMAEEKSREQKFIILFVGIGLVLVLVFAVFVFRSLRITRKQKHIIELQKNEVVHQKHLVEEKHKEITDSINYAERIQRSFLATQSMLNENLTDYFVFFQPKDVVSGDFYWASKLSNGNFALVTADSTGHGVPGAIMSILNISSLEKAVEQGLCSPADILNNTRKTIIDRLKKDGSPEGGKDGMDASLICFDFPNRSFSYAAANNPVWVVRGGFDSAQPPGFGSNQALVELIELKPDKMPVGKHDKDQESFTTHEFPFVAGDVVYALTDGLPDQFGGAKGKKFMYKKLKELLIAISTDPMEMQRQKLQDAFMDWKSDLEQVDDVTLIGIRL